MRIDKYLWCTRYFKTRNIATQACKKGSIRINGDQVKPAREVFPSDVIIVRKNQINYTLEVIEIPPSRMAAKLVGLYRIDTTPKEAFENNEMLQNAKSYYRKRGVGRPTKKDRRDLESFSDESEDE